MLVQFNLTHAMWMAIHSVLDKRIMFHHLPKGRRSCCIILQTKNLHIIPMIGNRQSLLFISKNGLSKPNWKILGC